MKKIIKANIPVPQDCFLHNLTKLHGRQIWKDAKGRYYIWDRLHGHIQKYNSAKFHIAVLDKDGNNIGKAIKGRTITI